jgi:hypothetical protein
LPCPLSLILCGSALEKTQKKNACSNHSGFGTGASDILLRLLY